MSQCICEFPEGCAGLGAIFCDGCGGDICVCAACDGAGQIECEGCEDCDRGEDFGDDIE